LGIPYYIIAADFETSAMNNEGTHPGIIIS
jgi:hypothetical protein